MTLNDQYNRSAPNNLRLSKLSSIPSAEDLSFAMTLATNNPRNIVELPWKVMAAVQQYTIKVTCALSLEEPRWMLHVGNGGEEDAVIWNYDTPDYQLIFNLITAECERANYVQPGGSPEQQNATNNGGTQHQGQFGQMQQQPMQQQMQQNPYGQQQQQQAPMQQPNAQQQQYQQPPQQGNPGFPAGPNPGFQTGQNPGFQTGQNPGFQTGQNPGIQTGPNPGFQTGPNPGFQTGQNPGFQTGPNPGFQTGANPGFQTGANPGFQTGPNPGFQTGANPGFQTGANPGFQTGANPGFQTGSSPTFNPQPSGIPIAGMPNTTGNDLPISAFGAAAASIGHAPPPVPPGLITPTPVIPQQQDAPYAAQQNPYAQQPYVSGGATQPAPYVEEPFTGVQSHSDGYAQQPGQPAPFQQQQQHTPAQAQYQQMAAADAPQYIQQPAPNQVTLPQEAPAQMPSSRLFTLPEAASVKNPAERLIDNATSATENAPKAPAVLPPPVRFDRAAVDTVFKMLTDTELGFLSHGALMFFTVREFSRFQRNNVPFSIVLFELGIPNGNRWEPMPLNLVKDVGKQLFGVMRPLDLIAHYDKDDFAMLLPHTSREDSFTVVQRLHEMLHSTAVAPGMAPGQAQIFCGIATIPDDCAHPGVAIAAALEAKSHAKAAGKPVLRFCDI